MPKVKIVEQDSWRKIRRVFYLGGLHKEGQKVITPLIAQGPVNIAAKVGTMIEVEDWVARELISKYQIQGKPCFTTNAKLAELVASGNYKAASGFMERVVEREMTDEEIIARADAIRAKKKGKPSKDTESPNLTDQLNVLADDLELERA